MSRTCIRCNEVLKDDVTFCVACGHENNSEIELRKAELENKFKLRIAMAKAFDRIATVLWFKNKF